MACQEAPGLPLSRLKCCLSLDRLLPQVVDSLLQPFNRVPCSTQQPIAAPTQESANRAPAIPVVVMVNREALASAALAATDRAPAPLEVRQHEEIFVSQLIARQEVLSRILACTLPVLPSPFRILRILAGLVRRVPLPMVRANPLSMDSGGVPLADAFRLPLLWGHGLVSSPPIGPSLAGGAAVLPPLGAIRWKRRGTVCADSVRGFIHGAMLVHCARIGE